MTSLSQYHAKQLKMLNKFNSVVYLLHFLITHKSNKRQLTEFYICLFALTLVEVNGAYQEAPLNLFLKKNLFA